MSNQDFFSLCINHTHTHTFSAGEPVNISVLTYFIPNEAGSNQTAKSEKIIKKLMEGFLPLCLF